jgi:hypothetical protein
MLYEFSSIFFYLIVFEIEVAINNLEDICRISVLGAIEIFYF